MYYHHQQNINDMEEPCSWMEVPIQTCSPLYLENSYHIGQIIMAPILVTPTFHGGETCRVYISLYNLLKKPHRHSHVHYIRTSPPPPPPRPAPLNSRCMFVEVMQKTRALTYEAFPEQHVESCWKEDL